jgi:hypothetical protein
MFSIALDPAALHAMRGPKCIGPNISIIKLTQQLLKTVNINMLIVEFVKFMTCGHADLPEVIFKPGSDGHNKDECSICLDDFESGTSLQMLPCGHLFHPHCIREWLSGHNFCPLCKRVLTSHPSDRQPESQQLLQNTADALEGLAEAINAAAMPPGILPSSDRGRQSMPSASPSPRIAARHAGAGNGDSDTAIANGLALPFGDAELPTRSGVQGPSAISGTQSTENILAEDVSTGGAGNRDTAQDSRTSSEGAAGACVPLQAAQPCHVTCGQYSDAVPQSFNQSVTVASLNRHPPQAPPDNGRERCTRTEGDSVDCVLSRGKGG